MISKICSFFSSAEPPKQDNQNPIMTGNLDDISPLDLTDPITSYSTILHINAAALERLLRDLQVTYGEFVIQIDDIGRDEIIGMLDRVSEERMRETLGMR